MSKKDKYLAQYLYNNQIETSLSDRPSIRNLLPPYNPPLLLMNGTQSNPIVIYDDDECPPITVAAMPNPVVHRRTMDTIDLFCHETLDEFPISSDFVEDACSVAYPYHELNDYFICQGWKVPRVVRIARKSYGLFIDMTGICPIHGYCHTTNHFFVFWFAKMYGSRVKDYLSCHHGVEKDNRILLDARLPFAYLQ